MMESFIIRDRFEQVWQLGLRSFYPQNRGEPLWEACRFVCENPGKRLRPWLCLLVCGLKGGDPYRALGEAVALEMIHTYSLVHDDLPAMDDASLRRGKPTVHVLYGEAMGILVGDALLADAWSILSDPSLFGLSSHVPPSGEGFSLIGRALGSRGLVLGQVEDLGLGSISRLSGSRVEDIHVKKTGQLFGLSAALGALKGGYEQEEVRAFYKFGEELGIAFQQKDDLMDYLGQGKPAEQDKRHGRFVHEKEDSFFRVKGCPEGLKNWLDYVLDSSST